MRIKSVSPFLLMAVLVLVVGACGASPMPTPADTRFVAPEAAPTRAAAAPTRAAAPAAATAAPAAAPTKASGSNSVSSTTNQSVEALAAAQSTRMVIYTSSIALEVKDTDFVVDSVTRVARDLGGYVVSSTARWEEDRRLATMVIRVLGNQHDQAIALLRGLAMKVLDYNSSTKDVGEEYADLDARVRTLEASEAQYLALLSKANTIDEILKVQEKAAQVRGEIDRMKGRMNYLSNQTDLATITVDIRPEIVPKPTPEPSPTPTAVPVQKPVWDPGLRATRAWDRSVSFLQRVADVLITVVVFFWWLVPVLILAAWAWNRWLRRRPRPPVPAMATASAGTAAPPAGDTPGGSATGGSSPPQ